MASKSYSTAIAAVMAGALSFGAFGPAAASEGDWINAVLAPKEPLANQRAGRPGAPSPGSKAGKRGSRTATEDGNPNKPTQLIGNHVAPPGSGRWQWVVSKDRWTATDEEAYAQFIRHIGESNCKTTHECLTSPVANPAYHATNPPGMQFFADCADLPFVLRAYFAWKNGLPFSFSTAVSTHTKLRSGKSISQAFQIIGRYHVVPPGPDPRLALNEVLRVSTAHFRVPTNYQGPMLPDHYPVDITRESVKAGTVIFDALGHIAIVYKVTDDGVIHYIDAHPDNSLTRSVFGSDIERAGPDTGAGFLRWRPQTLIGARKGQDGKLFGGMLMLARNEQLADWSDAQYFGSGPGRSSDWRAARYFFEGEELDYYGYVRLSLARKGYKFDPVAEVRMKVNTLCEELRQRVEAVNAAVRAGMPRRPQPPRLPSNIFVTSGDWEAYATPSRDAQLKLLFVALREDVQRFIAMHGAGSRHLEYNGSDLRADLRAAYDLEAGACSITYTRTDGSPQLLSFGELKKRLFLMSFDPHHCVERRWGATSAEELRTCPDDGLKQAWYEAQQRLRNQTVRTIGDRMNFTIEDLRRQARESSDEVGDDEPPVIEIASLLGAR